MKPTFKIFFPLIFLLFLFTPIQAQTNSYQELMAILKGLEKKPVPYDSLATELQTFRKNLPKGIPKFQNLSHQARFWEYEIMYRKLFSDTHFVPTTKDFGDLYTNFKSLLNSPNIHKELQTWIEYKLGFCQFRLAELAKDIDRAVVHYKSAGKHFNNIPEKKNELYFPAQLMRGICFIRRALLEEYSYNDDQIRNAKSDLLHAENIFKSLQLQKPELPFNSVAGKLLLGSTYYELGHVNLLLNDKKDAKISWNASLNSYQKILRDKNLSEDERRRVEYLLKMTRLNLYSLDLKLGDLGKNIHDYQVLLNHPYFPDFGLETNYRNRIDLPLILSISKTVHLGSFSSFSGDYVESSFWRALYDFLSGKTQNAENGLKQFLNSKFSDARRNVLLNFSHYYLAKLYFNENRFQDVIGQIDAISSESIKSVLSPNDILALSITAKIIGAHSQSSWLNIFLGETESINNQDKTTLVLKVIHTILNKYSLTNDPKYYDHLNSFIQQIHSNLSFAFLNEKSKNAIDYLLALGSVIRMRPYINQRGTYNLQRARSAYDDAMNKLSSIHAADKNLLGEIKYLQAYISYRMAQTYQVNQDDSYKDFINKSISSFIEAYNFSHNYRVLTRLGSLLFDPSLFPQHRFREQALICYKHVYDFFEQNPQFDPTDYFLDVARTNLGNFSEQASTLKILYQGKSFSLTIGNLDYKNSIPVVAGERISYDQIIDKDIRKRRKKQMALQIWQFYALPSLNIYPSIHKIESPIRNFKSSRLAGFIDEFHSLKVKLPVEVFYDSRQFVDIKNGLNVFVRLKNIPYSVAFNRQEDGKKIGLLTNMPKFCSGGKVRLEIQDRNGNILPIFRQITVGFFPDTLKFELSRKIEFEFQQAKQKNLKIDFEKLKEEKYNQLKTCLGTIPKIADRLSYDVKPFMGKALENSIYADLSNYPVEDTSTVVPADVLCDRNNRILLLDWKQSKVIVADRFGKTIREFGRFGVDNKNQIGQEIKLTYPLRFEILEPDKQHKYEMTLLLIADYYGIKICDLEGHYLGPIQKLANPKYYGSIGRIVSKGYGLNSVLYVFNRLNQVVYQFKAKEKR